MLKDKRILITGGTGSIGRHLAKRLLENGNFVVVIGRSEYRIAKTKHFLGEWKDKRRVLSVDIRDGKAMSKLVADSDVIFHLAALKHVDICERQPEEAQSINVKAVYPLFDMAIANGIESVICASSDKACLPCNIYGRQKAWLEKMVHENASLKTETRFSAVRCGNCLGSDGSVVPIMLMDARNGGIRLTDRTMTRFSMTVAEIVDMFLYAYEFSDGGDVFARESYSYGLGDLLQCILNRVENKKVKTIGLRAGERYHEPMVSVEEDRHAHMERVRFDTPYERENMFCVWQFPAGCAYEMPGDKPKMQSDELRWRLSEQEIAHAFESLKDNGEI